MRITVLRCQSRESLKFESCEVDFVESSPVAGNPASPDRAKSDLGLAPSHLDPPEQNLVA
jgi:hypothetical protein